MGYYEAGHMMYLRRPSLQRLKSDLVAFVRAALSATDLSEEAEG
jgi:carboxypeptidase C (cathepsin A)